MAIYGQLIEAEFDPPAIAAMTTAYELALVELQLIDRKDPVTRLVAEKVILVFRAGEAEPRAICRRALKELGVPPSDEL